MIEEAPHLMAQCRLASGRHIELAVLDISLCGCMIDRRGWTPAPDERILMRLPGLSSQPATVTWVEGEKAGLTFEQALYEPVLAHLQQSIDGALQPAP